MFFVTYAAFEVPANVMLKKLRPSLWIATIMCLWGIVGFALAPSVCKESRLLFECPGCNIPRPGSELPTVDCFPLDAGSI